MKKIFLLFLAMTSLHVFSQNVMVVEHQDGKIERYSTQDVNNVGIRFTGDKSVLPLNSIYPKRSLEGLDPMSLEVRKSFLWPFPEEEVNPQGRRGLIQNPGW